MRPLSPLLLCLAIPACSRSQAPAAPRDAIAYTMVRHAQSGAVLPRLTDTSGTAALAVNRQLDSAAAEMRCLDEFSPDPRETWYDSDASVAYAADSVFSVDIGAGYYCGGAYPENGANFSLTFDLRTGSSVKFRDLWADWDRDGKAIVRTIYPEQVRHAAAVVEPHPDDCSQYYAADELADRFFDYTFSDSGLVVEPEFPHMIEACIDQAVVPYARLRPYAAPGGILLRVAGRR